MSGGAPGAVGFCGPRGGFVVGLRQPFFQRDPVHSPFPGPEIRVPDQRPPLLCHGIRQWRGGESWGGRSAALWAAGTLPGLSSSPLAPIHPHAYPEAACGLAASCGRGGGLLRVTLGRKTHSPSSCAFSLPTPARTAIASWLQWCHPAPAAVAHGALPPAALLPPVQGAGLH